jgi:hypothetical protein
MISFCGAAVGVHIESEAAASAVPTSSRDLAPAAVPETTPAAATAEATPAPEVCPRGVVTEICNLMSL